MVGDIEEKVVTAAEARQGVKLQGGHAVVLVVSDLHGSPARKAPARASKEAPANAPATDDGAGSDDEPPPETEPPPPPPPETEPPPPPPPETEPPPPPETEPPPPPETEPPPPPDPLPDTPSVLGTLDASHFDTAKCFPLPDAIPAFRAVAQRINAEPSRTLLIVGHTDTKGSEDFNLDLSRERAAAISAYLRNAAGEWTPFYSHSDDQKRWGTREDQSMLSALGEPPYYDGAVDGIAGPKTKAALGRFQSDHKLPDTAGEPDDDTRAALVLAYMQAEGTTVPAGASIRVLGCGMHHLAQPTGPGVANAANRRVDIFAFEKEPIVPAPEDCEGGAHPGCTVYDRWKAAVTGAIDTPPPPTRIRSFGVTSTPASEEGLAPTSSKIDADADAEEGEIFGVAWQIDGPFTSVLLNGSPADADTNTDGSGSAGLTAARPAILKGNGERTDTVDLVVTSPSGAKVTAAAKVNVHRTIWLEKKFGPITYGLDISQNTSTNWDKLLKDDRIRGHIIKFFFQEVSVGTQPCAVFDKVTKKPVVVHFPLNWPELVKRPQVVRGCYHFLTNEDPIAQAKKFIEIIVTTTSVKSLSGALPPVIDIELEAEPPFAEKKKREDEQKAAGKDPIVWASADYLKNARKWIEFIEDPKTGFGVPPIIYTGPNPWNSYSRISTAAERAFFSKYKLFIAQYGTFGNEKKPDDLAEWGPDGWTFWQFNGSDGNTEPLTLNARLNVDFNVFKGDIPALRSLIVP